MPQRTSIRYRRSGIQCWRYKSYSQDGMQCMNCWQCWWSNPMGTKVGIVRLVRNWNMGRGTAPHNSPIGCWRNTSQDMLDSCRRTEGCTKDNQACTNCTQAQLDRLYKSEHMADICVLWGCRTDRKSSFEHIYKLPSGRSTGRYTLGHICVWVDTPSIFLEWEGRWEHIPWRYHRQTMVRDSYRHTVEHLQW